MQRREIARHISHVNSLQASIPRTGVGDLKARGHWVAMTGSASIATFLPPASCSIVGGNPSKRCQVGSPASVAQSSALSGDSPSVSQEERFRTTFEQHYRAVARFVRTRGHGSADAEDIIAATFEVAWKRMDKLPEGREALPWLLGIARNLSRNAQRKSKREASFVNELSTVTVPWAEMPIEDRAASAEVMAALAQLRPLDRDLILLVAWDELSPAEAGQVLGLRPATARSRLHRTRQRMSILMQESGGSPRSSAGLSPRSVSAREDDRAR